MSDRIKNLFFVQENSYTIKHVTIETEVGYDEFTSNIEGMLGRFDIDAFHELKGDPVALKAKFREMEGSGELMIFGIQEHGLLMSIYGQPGRARQYTIGNPILGAKLTRYDKRAAQYSPSRLLVYETEAGAVKAGYDLPSSLFAHLKNNMINEIAANLDHKILQALKEAARRK